MSGPASLEASAEVRLRPALLRDNSESVATPMDEQHTDMDQDGEHDSSQGKCNIWTRKRTNWKTDVNRIARKKPSKRWSRSASHAPHVADLSDSLHSVSHRVRPARAQLQLWRGRTSATLAMPVRLLHVGQFGYLGGPAEQQAGGSSIRPGFLTLVEADQSTTLRQSTTLANMEVPSWPVGLGRSRKFSRSTWYTMPGAFLALTPILGVDVPVTPLKTGFRSTAALLRVTLVKTEVLRLLGYISLFGRRDIKRPYRPVPGRDAKDPSKQEQKVLKGAKTISRGAAHLKLLAGEFTNLEVGAPPLPQPRSVYVFLFDDLHHDDDWFLGIVTAAVNKSLETFMCLRGFRVAAQLKRMTQLA
ncbi:hypothetical protein HPB48_025003 [Haemaphysalis longicornis]|uniref:Uncharacterized protein n=1 Tax=Haemaphysalis longicornis TaxID=44386 RepID=A0A9J6H6Z0_HAELO|nr:hypothetical protein HPB48_025003 [Haemaphysalis longicornis]